MSTCDKRERKYTRLPSNRKKELLQSIKENMQLYSKISIKLSLPINKESISVINEIINVCKIIRSDSSMVLNSIDGDVTTEKLRKLDKQRMLLSFINSLTKLVLVPMCNNENTPKINISNYNEETINFIKECDVNIVDDVVTLESVSESINDMHNQILKLC